MDKPDSTQPQQTGGLKLMTVFIAVLALHVLVIGGFTVYHLMGSGGDADLTQDKTHKLRADGTAITDAATPDSPAGDKTTDTASTDTASSPAATGTTTPSAPDATPAAATPTTAATATTTAPAPAVAATAPVNPAPAPKGATASSSPIVLSSDDMSQTSTVPPGLAPPPDAPAVTPATESAPSEASATAPAAGMSPNAPSGPVHMPANPPTSVATTALAAGPDHAAVHEEHRDALAREAKHETYIVKITDSYKKIAHDHHITVAQLKAANHIKDNVLHTGQKLIIPESRTAVARDGASHDSTATGETVGLVSGTTHHHLYTVAKGDTLRKIAKKFDVTASEIEEVNGLPGNKISVGEKLRIPSHEARTTASAAPVREPSTVSWSAPETSTVSAPAPEQSYAPAPVTAPSALPPSQVETQPAPVTQPAPAPAPEPQPSTESNPALANLTF